MKVHIVWLGALCLLIGTGLGAADGRADEGGETRIENVVVTATMTEKMVKDAPGAVEIISEQEIVEMNAQTVAEAIEEAAGLVVTTETGRQMRPGIRGTGKLHTLVLVDGRRIAAGFKDMTGLEQIPVDLVKRIEIVRGPAAALYGSDAIGGVVNIITKRPPQKLALGATAQYGQTTYSEGDEGVGSAYAGTTIGRLGVLMAGGYREQDGYDRDGVAPSDQDKVRLKSAGGRFSYKLGEDHELLAGFECVDRTAIGLRDMEGLDRERDAVDRSHNLFLEYDGKPTPLSNLMVRLNRSAHDTDTEITPATAPIPGAIGDESDSQRVLEQAEARYSSLLGERHVLTLGGEYRQESREDDTGLDDSIDNVSVYVQDEYRIFDPLSLVATVRMDEHSEFGNQWTPRVAAVYRILDNLRFKAAYGQGFRAPGFMELYIPTYMKRGKEIYEPNEDLDPEESESWELGIEGEYKDFQARITGFQNEIENLIEAVYYKSTGKGKTKKDYYQYRNISEATMSGVEFEGRWKLPMGFVLSGNLTWLETENKTTGEDLEGRPDYKGSVKLAYRHVASGIDANVRVNHTGDRYYAAGDRDDITLVNAYLSKRLTDQVKLFAGVDNIFNTTEEFTDEPTFLYTGISVTY
jgi:outer membrane receptor for ferrienterochelin and colicins